MSNKNFCVYLTIYRGNKLPPFYIGWSSKPENVLYQKYHGSVSSKKYKKIYKKEIRNNPHLFKSIILSYFNTEDEAKSREQFLHEYFDVANNPLYFNMVNGNVKLGRYRTSHTEEAKNIIKKANLGIVSAKDKDGNIFKVTTDEFYSNNELMGVAANRIRPLDERERISKAHTGKIVPKSVTKKTSITRRIRFKQGLIGFSEEGLRSLSEKSKNMVVCKNKEGETFKITKEEFDSRKGIDLFGVNKDIILQCPHCNVSMHSANAKKYHFDNCKENYQNIYFWGS